MSVFRFLSAIALALIVVFLGACGNDSNNSSPAQTAVVHRLVSIQVTSAAINKPLGLAQQYTATGNYSDGTTQDLTAAVSWVSSDPGKVTIDANGLAHAVAVGVATITASMSGMSSNTANITVTPASLVSIQVTPATISLAAGSTQQYQAIGTYSDSTTHDITTTAVWSSSDTGKATIAANGLATTLAAGPTNISAVVGGVASNVATLTVTSATLQAIQVAPGTTTFPVGLTQQFSVTGTFSDGSTADVTSQVSWTSTDPSKATINPAGLATAVGAGSLHIAAQLGGIVSSAALTITPASLQSIAVTPTQASAPVGTTQQYSAIGAYSDGTTQDLTSSASWTSNVPSVATISASGLATAVVPGPTHIVATSGGVQSNGATLTVVAATLSSIAITPTSASKAVGGTQQYTATGTYNNNTTQDVTSTVSWHSSDTSKATIGTSGLATAVAAGAPSITATSGGLTSNAATLTVTGTRHSGGSINMNFPHAEHASVRLANGKVLVISGDFNATCELYDPSTGLWTQTGSLTTQRTLAVAGLLPNGKVLIAGGVDSNSNYTASTEIYDPATGTWSPGAPMPTFRIYATAATLSNGKFLVAGGLVQGTVVNTAVLYDPTSNTWTAAAPMTTSRYLHAMTALSGGRMLVTGGYSNGVTNAAEIYNATANTWTATGAMTTARYYHTLTTLSDGRVLAAGGTGNGATATAELFNPSTNTWTATGSLSIARYLQGAAALTDGTVMVFGGYVNSGLTNTTETFNPNTGTWSMAGPTATIRVFMGVNVLQDGTVLLSGGQGDAASPSTSETF
jgi:hypothetical protein